MSIGAVKAVEIGDGAMVSCRLPVRHGGGGGEDGIPVKMGQVRFHRADGAGVGPDPDTETGEDAAGHGSCTLPAAP